MTRTAVHGAIDGVLSRHGLGSGTPLADALADAVADVLRAAARTPVPDPVPGNGAPVPVEALDLSTRAYNCLKRGGLHAVEDVLARRAVPDPRDESLHDLRNCGAHTVSEIVEALAKADSPHPDDAEARSQDWFSAARPAPAGSASSGARSRTTCPECGRDVGVRRGGRTVMWHNRAASSDSRPNTCPGADRPVTVDASS